MRVMVVTWLEHASLSVSALQKRYISEKCPKLRVSRFPKSGPSVKSRFGFLGTSIAFSGTIELERNRDNNHAEETAKR